MKKQVLGCLSIAALALLVFSLMGNVLLSGMLFGKSADIVQEPQRFQQLLVQPGTAAADHGPRIAQIDLTGVISSDEGRDGSSLVTEMKLALAQALADSQVKAIVLRIDSPGGEVTASDTIYHAVKQANEQKPVVVYMDSMAASGGYYVSCGARKIIANVNTWTGSIGVIIQSLGYAGIMDKVGIKTRVFRSGSFKDAMGGHREMTAEEQAYVQTLVTETYERFVTIVSTARGVPVETLKNGIADGRIISGADAVTLKLVDRTGYIEDAWQEARDLAGVKDAAVIKYTRPAPLISLPSILSKASAAAPRLEIDLADRLLPKLHPGRCYLLPESLVP
jgi:protease IV